MRRTKRALAFFMVLALTVALLVPTFVMPIVSYVHEDPVEIAGDGYDFPPPKGGPGTGGDTGSDSNSASINI